jgi:cytochrome b6-f complex iron-sulfur subunit
LNTAGGFYIDKTNNIMIARTIANEFLAVSSLCTHQQATIDFEPSSNRFSCSAHGSVFSTTGTVLNGPAAAPLKQYKTSLSGNNLRVYA